MLLIMKVVILFFGYKILLGIFGYKSTVFSSQLVNILLLESIEKNSIVIKQTNMQKI